MAIHVLAAALLLLRRIFRLGVLLALCPVLGGCAMFESIFRVHDFTEPQDGRTSAIVTDAKQRVIFNIRASEHKDFLGRIEPKSLICAEPSPDVAQAFSTAISATIQAAATKSATDNKELSAGLAFSATESLVQLGTRIATIQLLRDELADLCRSFANGAVSSTTYTVRLSRLDKKMITLLMGEAASGALSRALVAVSGSAAAGNAPAKSEDVKKAQKELTDLGASIKKLQDEIADSATPEADKAKKRDELTQKTSEFEKKNAEYYVLLRANAQASTAGTLSTSTFGQVMQATSFSGVDLSLLQRQFLEDDELGTVLDACIASLDVVKKTAATGAERGVQATLSPFLATRSVALERKERAAVELRGVDDRIKDAEFRMSRLQAATAISVKEWESLNTEIASLRAEQIKKRVELASAEVAVRSAEDQIDLVRFDKGSGAVDSNLAFWCKNKMDSVLRIFEARDYTRMRLEIDLERARVDRVKAESDLKAAQLSICAGVLGKPDAAGDLAVYCKGILRTASASEQGASPKPR